MTWTQAHTLRTVVAVLALVLGAWLLRTPDAVLLERRPGQGIWGGLLSLPELAAQTEGEALAEAQRWLAVRGLAADGVQTLPALSHGFTHFELRLVPLLAHLPGTTPFTADSTLHWQPLATLATAALPAPVRRLLDAQTRTGHD